MKTDDTLKNETPKGEGPYEVFIQSQQSIAQSSYFEVSGISSAGPYKWLHCSASSNLLRILEKAFERALPVKVTVGEPYRSPDGQPGATVQQASIIHFPQ